MLIKSNLEPLNYDDVIILPNYSEIDSRDDVNLFLNGKNYMPIFSAPMKDISEVNMILELDKLGGVGILHRFFEKEIYKYEAVEILSSCNNFGISIGINDWENEIKYVQHAINNNCKFITVDTASGYHKNTHEAVKRLSEYRSNKKLEFKIIAGNVVDESGCLYLIKSGADVIRCNIGTGDQCLTSKSIGIGCPPLTAIKNCYKIKEKYPHITLLADGGISTPRRALNALVFGSDGIMLGSLLGRAIECENNGIIYGMSSFFLQEKMNKKKKSNEGTVTIIPKEEIRQLKDIFNEFTYGLQSSLSYIGCKDINNLRNIDIEFIKVK